VDQHKGDASRRFKRVRSRNREGWLSPRLLDRLDLPLAHETRVALDVVVEELPEFEGAGRDELAADVGKARLHVGRLEVDVWRRRNFDMSTSPLRGATVFASA
jgi:hypothetical protein